MDKKNGGVSLPVHRSGGLESMNDTNKHRVAWDLSHDAQP